MKKAKTSYFSGFLVEGFTLIELSISLIIIGLIVAGILGAQDLIRQSEVHATIKDMRAYHSAFNTFQLKYDAWPGDLRNATSYWTSGTANGDGDGRIEAYPETYRAWQHLNLSEILPGGYTGVSGSGGWLLRPDENAPSTPLTENSTVIVLYQSIYTQTQNHMQLSGEDSNNAGFFGGGLLSPADAMAIEDKIDNGNFGTGQLMVTRGNSEAGCSNKGYPDPPPVTPVLSDTLESCRLFYKIDK